MGYSRSPGTTTTGGGSAPAPVAATPYVIGPRFAFFGDSITNYFETYGMYAAWLSGGKIEPVNIVSHPGYNSTQLAGLIQSEVVAIGGVDTCVVLCGSNDAGGNVTLATFSGNITSMVTALRAGGIAPVLITLPPRSGRVALVGTYNAWLNRYAAINDIPLVDINSVFADPATGDYRTAYAAGDGIHPNADGNKALGLAVANTLTPLIGTQRYQVQPYSGGPNLLTNSAFLAGTNVPTGFGAGVNTSTPGVAHSLVADPAGFKWHRATFTAATTNTFAGFQIDAGAGTFAIGDRLRFSAMLRLPGDIAGAGVGEGLVVRATCYAAGYASSPLDAVLTGPPAGSRAFTRAGVGSLVMEFVVPANTALILFGVVGGTASAGSGVYEYALPTLLNLTKMGVS